MEQHGKVEYARICCTILSKPSRVPISKPELGYRFKAELPQAARKGSMPFFH